MRAWLALRVGVTLGAGALALAGCQPLERDMSTLPPEGGAGELAIVEETAPARIPKMSAGDRLVPLAVFGGPIALAVVGTHEGDFNTVNGRQYLLRMADGEKRAVQGFAIMQAGDCVLLRKDGAGRYLTPVRQEAGTCKF